MSKVLQFRRDTTSGISTVTGAAGELFVDLSKDTLVVMDGTTQGGQALQKELVESSNITVGIITATSIESSNITVGIITATSINVPPVPITFSPAIGATDVALASNIIITFNGTVAKGTGNITLRSGSAGGTVHETIGVSSSSVSISGGVVTIDPVSSLPDATNVFVVVDAGAFSGITTTLTNALINTYSFTTATVPINLGDSYEGGFLICKASPVRWVVSPYSTEVQRNWFDRNDANTTAQSVSGCTGWFVPTISQLLNPGYCCRSFWGPAPCYTPPGFYWSSTEVPGSNYNPYLPYLFYNACMLRMYTGQQLTAYSSNPYRVRAFRCVTY